jgi:hypothetical protein
VFNPTTEIIRSQSGDAARQQVMSCAERARGGLDDGRQPRLFGKAGDAAYPIGVRIPRAPGPLGDAKRHLVPKPRGVHREQLGSRLLHADERIRAVQQHRIEWDVIEISVDLLVDARGCDPEAIERADEDEMIDRLRDVQAHRLAFAQSGRGEPTLGGDDAAREPAVGNHEALGDHR